MLSKNVDKTSFYGLLRAFLVSVFALMQLAGCGSSTTATQLTAPIDYSQSQSWVMLPKEAVQPVDLFFLYPTTYNSAQPLTSTWSRGWNQTLEQALSDQVILLQTASKVSVFTKAGVNVYAPYYQQCSGLDVLNALLWQNTPDNTEVANQAMEVAYKDASDAFDYYLEHYNKDAQGKPRPFILAGHSQGSNLMLYLLERKFSNPALRKLLVAAYVIGWSVTSNDMTSYPESLQRNKGTLLTYKLIP